MFSCGTNVPRKPFETVYHRLLYCCSHLAFYHRYCTKKLPVFLLNDCIKVCYSTKTCSYNIDINDGVSQGGILVPSIVDISRPLYKSTTNHNCRSQNCNQERKRAWSVQSENSQQNSGDKEDKIIEVSFKKDHRSIRNGSHVKNRSFSI